MNRRITLSRRVTLVLGGSALLGACASGGTSTPEPAPAPAQAAQAARTAQPAADTALASPSALPPARQILDRYVEAVGGRALIQQRKSSHTTGLFEVPQQGLAGQLDVYAAAPNRIFVKTSFPQMGEMMSGYDGTTAWSIDPMQGPRLLEGKELEGTRVQADFYGRLHDASNFTSMETTELTDFEGKPAYKVHLVRTNGEAVDELFDPATGLLVGSIATRDTPMGSMTVTSIVSDYKSFGGQLLPTRVVQRVAGQEIVVTISSVEYDSVDPAMFELPAQIKALTTLREK